MSTWRARGSVLVVGCILLVAACSSPSNPTVDLAKAESGLQKVIKKQWFPSLDVGAVRCPTKKIPRSKGKVSTCTVTVAKMPVEFRVVQTNGQGGIVPRPYEAILSKAKAEAFIRTNVRDLATVSCGTTKYFVRKPGTQFSCDVIATNGRQAKVFYRVVDPAGNIKFARNT